ncbi:MAG: phosphate ABC transporter substrate-binding protein PstS [Deltaproteobacteria bacterium]|nr:phosphate ABC transporter substrate-binding protein PstS [Deltaproteobacteria bacterium]MBN2670216.1 phosphate ABC transporter substrate-binding protein PstS [Deltaproteobacteria bacterium]
MFVVALGCGKQTPPQAKQEEKNAAGDDAAVPAETAEAITLTGAGATFPFPIYSKWAHAYKKVKGTKLNYQSIGSGGGIAQIKAKTVAFGASDAPLEAAELDEAGLIQFPMIMGGVVPVVNLEGVTPGQLKLSQSVLADIFLGKIKKWNDAKIAKDNDGMKLPATDISVVHRADGSGTTWIFTNYLDKISEEWKTKVGTGKSVEWPTGVGGKGNEGVAAYVQRIKGAIGYVEFAYALQNNMSHAKLQNVDGNYVDPTIESFQAAAANADWKNAPGFYLVLTNQPGAGSWPITGASFILMYKEQDKPEIAKEALNFFDWCYENGQKSATELHYVPMPKEVVELVHTLWKEKMASGGTPVWQ